MMRSSLTHIVALAMLSSTAACQVKSMTTTEANKAFITKMLSEKKRLEDFPDRFEPNITMYEPATLPFGGTYHGLQEFQKFYPDVRRYYDFETWHVLGVYADGDTVFATTRVGVAGTSRVMYIAEQFTFNGDKIAAVRVHICDTQAGAS
jgi:SnoaL-like protein